MTASATEPRPETEASEETLRRAQLVHRLVRAMAALTVVAFAVALFEPKNDQLISLGFYGTVALGLLGIEHLTRRGYVVLAAWVLSLFFWVLIVFVTLFFGGLQGQNASIFGVSVMLIGSVVGGRAALGLSLVTSAWCALLAVLEAGGHLPPQLGGYSPINAWSAVTVTLLLISVLLHTSLDSLRRAHDRAAANARERDAALRKSVEAQKMELVGNLSGGIAHDFNNLLTVISGSTSLLRDQLKDAQDTDPQYLDDIEAATTRATLMTRQLLSFSSGKANDSAAVDLAEVVRSMSRLLPRLLDSKIEVLVETPSSAVVLASRAGLEQILLNLSVNARDAMPEGGQLTLGLSVEGEAAVLIARDTGVGMDAATCARVFEPFFTTKQTGTGLGLATAHARVAQLGGSISVTSALGQGATFTVRLPLHHGTPARISRPSSLPVTPGTRRRALLVEDDALVRRSVGRLLERAGFDVSAVANGAEALALLASNAHFALVMSDISMPLIDGRSLAATLASLRPELPVVLMSGNPQPDDEPLPQGRAVLRKPIEEAGAASRSARRAATELKAPHGDARLR